MFSHPDTDDPDLIDVKPPRLDRASRRRYRLEIAKAQLPVSLLVLAGVVACVGIAQPFAPSSHTLGDLWPYVVGVIVLVTMSFLARWLSATAVLWAYTLVLIVVIGSFQVSLAVRPSLGMQILLFVLVPVLASLSLSWQTLLMGFVGLQIVDLAFIRPVFQPPPLTYSMTVVTFAVMLVVLLLTAVRIHTTNAQADLMNSLRSLAIVDPLTGLLNRRGLLTELPLLTQTADRLVVPVVVTYLDLDHLKIINDTHGHHVGDQIIASIGTALRDNRRANDLCARVGGDEFVIVSHGDLESHRVFLDRVRQQLQGQSERFPWWDGGFTSGSASGLLRSTSIEELAEKADATLFENKRMRQAEPANGPDVVG